MGINKYSPGCTCCGPFTSGKFESSSSAITLWDAPPCPQNNRIGIDVTIENMTDCNDYPGNIFLGEPNCGSCTRTFSNMNGTYYVPAPYEFVLYQNTVEVICGQWYTGNDSCVGPGGGGCVAPSTYSYFLIRAVFTCDATNGLQIAGGYDVSVWACDVDGNTYTTAMGTSLTTASSWNGLTGYPNCCQYGTLSGSSVCCNQVACTGVSTVTGQYKFEWVTAS